MDLKRKWSNLTSFMVVYCHVLVFFLCIHQLWGWNYLFSFQPRWYLNIQSPKLEVNALAQAFMRTNPVFIGKANGKRSDSNPRPWELVDTHDCSALTHSSTTARFACITYWALEIYFIVYWSISLKSSYATFESSDQVTRILNVSGSIPFSPGYWIHPDYTGPAAGIPTHMISFHLNAPKS